MGKLREPTIRFRVEPGNVPAEKVACRLHLTLPAFETCKTRLFMRGFPRPDPDTSMYDVEAVDRWRHRRHPSLFPELVASEADPSAAAPAKSLGQIAREAEERQKTEGRRRVVLPRHPTGQQAT